MIDGLDKLAEIEVLREAAQRPPAEVQRMQMPSPQAGLQSLGQQEVDMGTGMPVGFSPVDAVGQITNIAGQYALANPQKTGPFAAALAAFGAGSEAANMIDKRIEAESERENLADVKSMAGSLPDRTRTVIPTMDMPVQAQEEIQISEVAPQAGLASMMPMKKGGSIQKVDQTTTEDEDINSFVDFLKDKEGIEYTARIPTKGDRLTIGHGHASSNVKVGQKITKEEADTLLRQDIRQRLPQIRRRIPKFNSFPKDLQVAVLGEWFRGSLGGSPETIRLINSGKFDEASKEFLNNDEYRDAKKRGRPGIRPRMELVAEELEDYYNESILDEEDEADPFTKEGEASLAQLAALKQTAIETPPKAESKDTDFIGSAREAGKGLLNLLGRDYTVKGGDTLSSIAKQSGVSVEDLLESNPNIVDRDEIAIGQEVDVPNMKSFVGQFKNAFGFKEGGDVGEYFEGQVEGKGDGMSDEIPFRVKGGNPDFALLSKDEYVIPADVVSMLGNGSSDAGADELDDFLTDVRKEAFGREEQQKEIDAEKGLSSIA
jgi:LysM repeat protein/GH24 family phage-related lysozyme (muramidase)|tara:strand:+ start:1390 stop:3024 length:1635 start_codon:yes stop_codon:yes gene_type:complete